MNPIWEALGGVGNVLDMPGSYLRGALAGRPGERASGRDLLSTYGLADESDPWGGLKGFGTELITDPLMLGGQALGAWKLGKAARGLAGADDVAPLARGIAGFLGDEEGAVRLFREVGQRSDPELVNAKTWYHGNATPGMTAESLDPMKTSASNLFGRGIYTTESNEIPLGYARARIGQADPAVGFLMGIGVRPQNFKGSARPMIYEANTALGNILDLDRPISDYGGSFREGLVDLVRKYADLPQMEHRAWIERRAQEARDLLVRERPDLDYESLLMEMEASPPRIDITNPKNGITPPIQEAIRAIQDEHRFYMQPPDFHSRRFLPYLNDRSQTVGNAVQLLRPDVGLSKHSQDDIFLSDLMGKGNEYMIDPLVRGLREMGWDALTHTGGLRSKGPEHQVLIALDPNDLISRVGRSGQVTRFEPWDMEGVMRKLLGEGT